MKYFLFSLILLFFNSCNSYKKNEPIVSSLKDSLIKPQCIYYQFYEKFGFTDLCEHYRILYKSNLAQDFRSWKKLPVNKSDLDKMNSISNKVDVIGIDRFDVRNKKKNHFKDISLDSREYYSSDTCDYVLKMQRGYYYYNIEKIVIYDEDSQLFYEEVHQCDGL